MEKNIKYSKILCIVYLSFTILFYCFLPLLQVNFPFSLVGAHGLYFIFLLFLLFRDVFSLAGSFLAYGCLLCEVIYVLSLILVSVCALKNKRYTPFRIFMVVSNAVTICVVLLAYCLNGGGAVPGWGIWCSIVGNIIYTILFCKVCSIE